LSTASIHPTAVVSPKAVLGEHVHIGPFAVIEPGAVIGDGCRLAARVSVRSGVVLGNDNEVHEGTVLGGKPQHLRAGERVGGVQIGNANMIREHVTVHLALHEGEYTRIGDRNLLMVGAHVAHDCRLGNHTIITNNVLLAGHVTVEDRAYLSGGVAVHQYLRIGRYAIVGGLGHVKADVPPYVTVDGDSNKVVGLNVIGLRRGGFTPEEIQQLKAAYRVIYRSGLKWSNVLARLKAEFTQGPAAYFHEFLSGSQRGVVQERRTPRMAMVPLVVDADENPAQPQLHKVG
jgi:UDP-N-acetylglucosamine acyltransferase